MTHGQQSTAAARRARRILDALAIAIFLALIAAPTVDAWVRPAASRSPLRHELRTPAPKPERPRSVAEFTALPAACDAYFKDSFGLRDKLLRWDHIVKVFGFGISPSADVILGDNDFVFYAGELSRENHRGALPFTPAELARWGDVLEAKRAVLDALGVRYLYVIAPDKETVYADWLPASMEPIGPTRKAQWLAFMKEHHPRVEVLDLTEALVAARADDAPDDWVYGNLGTHWSGRGSLVALKALSTRLDDLVGGFEPALLDDFRRVPSDMGGDSWASRMYLGDLLRQVDTAMVPAQPRARATVQGELHFGRVRTSVIEGSSRPRLFLMHDSFGPYVELGLAEQCSFLEARWALSVDAAEVAAARPAALVDLRVERTFNTLPPEELALTEDAAWGERFRASDCILLAADKTRDDWGIAPLGAAKLGPAVATPKPRLPVSVENIAARLGFPILTPIAGETPVLHLSIESSCATDLVLFHREPGADRDDPHCAYRRRLREGANEFFVPLDRLDAPGELRLRPGDPACTFQLREFEVRSVRRP
ncbi:MAG TPA: hypothetical protein VM509_04755 [Planctomycetota bacterium]|nr:hypothetical protein [Planctomycetota bacterium]